MLNSFFLAHIKLPNTKYYDSDMKEVNYVNFLPFIILGVFLMYFNVLIFLQLMMIHLCFFNKIFVPCL